MKLAIRMKYEIKVNYLEQFLGSRCGIEDHDSFWRLNFHTVNIASYVSIFSNLANCNVAITILCIS